MKTTSNGRRPQNIWSWITHQTKPQILNLNIGDQIKVKNFLKWRWPPMEDDLKIRKLIGSSSNFKFMLRDQTKINFFLKWRRLKISKVEYLSNCWLDLPHISNWCYDDNLQWKVTSKYLMLNISATPDRIFLKFLNLHIGNQTKIKLK